MMRFKRILYSWLSIAILSIAVIVVAHSSLGVFEKAEDSAKSLTQAEVELARASLRQNFLMGEIKKLESPDGIDKEIRNRYRVHKAGEKLIVLVDGEDAVASSSATSTPRDKRSFWQSLFHFFGGGQ